MKKILVMAAVAAFVFACGNAPKQAERCCPETAQTEGCCPEKNQLECDHTGEKGKVCCKDGTICPGKENCDNKSNIVHVYYFHGKARCKTCVEVGNVARESVKKFFGNADNVLFSDINTTEKIYDFLVEKYEVTWNALIIAKGDDFIEITKQAFATAVKEPQTLENLIKNEVEKRLQ